MPILLLLVLLSCFPFAADAAEQLTLDVPEMSGGIYYAYPVVKDSLPDIPEGYSPVYISHYGRHGSRWPMKERIYKVSSDFFQQEQLNENLTSEGKRIWRLVSRCAANFQGHKGELTSLGERQHAAIAERLAGRFPSLLSDSSFVVARSSVEPRCIMSMAAFSEALKGVSPGIRISRHATPGDMEFIHHKSADADLANSDIAPWRWGFDARRDSLSMCRKAAGKLFKTIPQNDSLPLFMRCLHDIAVSVQDIDSLEADILPLFEPAELADLWKAANYIQYVGNARSPLVDAVGSECARTLLDEITSRADEMLEEGPVDVDLRFGHDTDLIRLLSLIQADGCDLVSEDPDEVALRWRNFEISPMAANLQLVFFRNGEGKVLVCPRLNENPLAISDVPQEYPGYYDWDLLKIYFSTL